MVHWFRKAVCKTFVDLIENGNRFCSIAIQIISHITGCYNSCRIYESRAFFIFDGYYLYKFVLNSILLILLAIMVECAYFWFAHGCEPTYASTFCGTSARIFVTNVCTYYSDPDTTPWAIKNVALCFCPHLRQLLAEHFRATLRWIIRITLDCVRPTQFSVYRPFTAVLVWSAFFNFAKMFICYYRYQCIFHWYFTRKCRDTFMVWWDM